MTAALAETYEVGRLNRNTGLFMSFGANLDTMKLNQRLPSVIVLSHNGIDTIVSHDPDFPDNPNGHLCLVDSRPSATITQSEV